MKTLFLSLALVALTITLPAQQKSSPVLDEYYKSLRREFVADNAYKTVAFVEQRWRIAGNSGFNESIYHVEKVLQEAGFKKEASGEADSPLTYRIETRKMNRPTWEPVSASVTLDRKSVV